MNQLQVFENELFKVSAKREGDQVLFDAEEVSRSLGFVSRTRKNGITYESVRWSRVNSFLPQVAEIKSGDLIPEPLVYKLAFKAQNEVAEKFQDWLAVEVIPTIRKTGGYVQENRAIDFVNSWLPQLDDHSKHAVASTLEQNRHLVNENKELVTKIEKQEPYVSFAETCMTSEKSLLVRELAKLCTKQGVVTGEKRLWQKLRDWKLVFKSKNEPYQEYVERGYFEIAQGVKGTSKGSFTWLTMRVKPKGQAYIINRLKKENEKLKEVQ